MLGPKLLCQVDKAPVIRLEVLIDFYCRHGVARDLRQLVVAQFAPAVGLCNYPGLRNVQSPRWILDQSSIVTSLGGKIPYPGGTDALRPTDRIPSPTAQQKSPEAKDLGASVRDFLWLLALGSNQRPTD